METGVNNVRRPRSCWKVANTSYLSWVLALTGLTGESKFQALPNGTRPFPLGPIVTWNSDTYSDNDTQVCPAFPWPKRSLWWVRRWTPRCTAAKSQKVKVQTVTVQCSNDFWDTSYAETWTTSWTTHDLIRPTSHLIIGPWQGTQRRTKQKLKSLTIWLVSRIAKTNGQTGSTTQQRSLKHFIIHAANQAQSNLLIHDHTPNCWRKWGGLVEIIEILHDNANAAR